MENVEICTYCGGSISQRRIELGLTMKTKDGMIHWNCDDAAYEEEIYMEEITLDQIWDIFNEANPDSEYMLSMADEDKIHEVLKKYAEAKNKLI